MNNETEEAQKVSAIKTLAIIGFITAAVLGVWLAVQIVRLIPAGFSSLASIADSLYSKETPFTVTPEKNIVDSEQSFTLSWNKMKDDGEYTFTYACTDGVSAVIEHTNGNKAQAPCDTDLMLENDATSTRVFFTSLSKRFVDVPYSLIFTHENGDLETFNGIVTVKNDSYIEAVALPIPEETKPATTTPVTTKPKPAVAPKPVVRVPTKVVTASYPVSNPRGSVDLETMFIAVGTFNENSKTFTSEESLEEGSAGAIRFQVKNIGTKTSDAWSYSVELPDNQDFTSKLQEGLEPNERAVITIAYGEVSHDRSVTIEIEANTSNDSVFSNNSFSKNIKVTN